MKETEVAAHLKKGTFIGEISFLTGEKPTADVLLESGSLVLVWDHEKLRQWISKNSDAAISFQRLMTSDLAQNLERIFFSKADSFFDDVKIDHKDSQKLENPEVNTVMPRQCQKKKHFPY